MPDTAIMPTAAKLAAAVCLGAVGWGVSELIRPLMPEQTVFGWFNHVNLGLGVLCGWLITGRRAGDGYVQSASSGLGGVAALVFWGLLAQSINEMLARALDRNYGGPVEALEGLAAVAVEFGAVLLDARVIGALLLGGIVTGGVAEWVSKRWS